MQPTGRTGAEVSSGGRLLERAKGRRIVRARASGLRLMRRSFYESDCQGHTSTSLIARASFPWQSAPNFAGEAKPAGAFGFAAQSASASVTSIRLPIRLDAGKHWGPGLQTMVLSETRPKAGLTLLRVLRGSLQLGECLGETEAGPTTCLRLPPAPSSGDSGALARGPSRTRRSNLPRYCACRVNWVGS